MLSSPLVTQDMGILGSYLLMVSDRSNCSLVWIFSLVLIVGPFTVLQIFIPTFQKWSFRLTWIFMSPLEPTNKFYFLPEIINFRFCCCYQESLTNTSASQVAWFLSSTWLLMAFMWSHFTHIYDDTIDLKITLCLKKFYNQ